MIKYIFKVETTFLDKTNKLKEVKKGDIIEVTEERLQELNKAEVGRVVSAKYIEDKSEKTTTKSKDKKDKKKELVDTPSTEETAEETEKEIVEETAEK